MIGINHGDGDLWDFRPPNRYPALKADLDADGAATSQEFGSQ